MATQRTKTPASSTAAAAAASADSVKLRQTQAEYSAARPSSEPGIKPMMSSSKMYVCRRCQANFKTGEFGYPERSAAAVVDAALA